MKFHRLFCTFAAIAVAMLLATGCSTVASRTKERPQAFQKLSAADQQLVQAGKIREGLGKDAVYIAWGRSDDVVEGSTKGKPSEMWIWLGYQQQTIPHYDVVPRYTCYGNFVPEFIYSPILISHPYVWRTAVFQNGKVASWTQGHLQ